MGDDKQALLETICATFAAITLLLLHETYTLCAIPVSGLLTDIVAKRSDFCRTKDLCINWNVYRQLINFVD